MKFAILGVGKVGFGVTQYLLDNIKNSAVGLYDRDPKFVEKIRAKYSDEQVSIININIENKQETIEKLQGYNSVVCCLPYHLNKIIAECSIEAGCHYTDLGGNDSVTDEILNMNEAAKKAGVSVVPDCGLAPGLVSIIAAEFLNKENDIDKITLRVGGIPLNPEPPFNYQVTFSAQGLINEYKEPVRILRNGKEEIAESLKGLEFFEFPGLGGVEAFNTSGGISTLPRTLGNRVKNISYKTIRFAGHCNLLNALRDTGFFDEEPTVDYNGEKIPPRKFLEAFLQQRYTSDKPDQIVLYCSAERDGERLITHRFIDQGDSSRDLTAMQKCTAIPAAVTSALQASRKYLQKGAIPQENAFESSEYLSLVKDWGIDIMEE